MQPINCFSWIWIVELHISLSVNCECNVYTLIVYVFIYIGVVNSSDDNVPPRFFTWKYKMFTIDYNYRLMLLIVQIEKICLRRFFRTEFFQIFWIFSKSILFERFQEMSKWSEMKLKRISKKLGMNVSLDKTSFEFIQII